jgi:hypothetical protein
MFQSKFELLILVLLSGFAGGFISNCMFAHAQGYEQVVSAKSFQLVNNAGKVIGFWTTCGADAPCLNFYDANNNVRLQLGLYGAPSEKGLPFVGLFDEKYQIKELLRLYGQAQAPVLVMKNNDQDRVIMGLNLQDSEEPFLVSFGKDGGQHVQFGNYSGK